MSIIDKLKNKRKDGIIGPKTIVVESLPVPKPKKKAKKQFDPTMKAKKTKK